MSIVWQQHLFTVSKVKELVTGEVKSRCFNRHVIIPFFLYFASPEALEMCTVEGQMSVGKWTRVEVE